jgi:hypothetical protein
VGELNRDLTRQTQFRFCPMCAATLPHNKWIVSHSQVATYGHFALHSYDQERFPLPPCDTLGEFVLQSSTGAPRETRGGLALKNPDPSGVTVKVFRKDGEIIVSFGIGEANERLMIETVEKQKDFYNSQFLNQDEGEMEEAEKKSKLPAKVTLLSSVHKHWKDMDIQYAIHTHTAFLARIFLMSTASKNLVHLLLHQPPGAVIFTGFSFACCLAEVVQLFYCETEATRRQLTFVHFGSPPTGTVNYQIHFKWIMRRNVLNNVIVKGAVVHIKGDSMHALFSRFQRHRCVQTHISTSQFNVFIPNPSLEGPTSPDRMIKIELFLAQHQPSKYREALDELAKLGSTRMDSIPLQQHISNVTDSIKPICYQITKDSVFPVKTEKYYGFDWDKFDAMKEEINAYDSLRILRGDLYDFNRGLLDAMSFNVVHDFVTKKNYHVNLVKKFIDHAVWCIHKGHSVNYSVQKTFNPLPVTKNDLSDLGNEQILAVCTALVFVCDRSVLDAYIDDASEPFFDTAKGMVKQLCHITSRMNRNPDHNQLYDIWMNYVPFLKSLDDYLEAYKQWSNKVCYTLEDFINDSSFWEFLDETARDCHCKHYYHLVQEMARFVHGLGLEICIRDPILTTESELAVAALPPPPESAYKTKAIEGMPPYDVQKLLQQTEFWEDLETGEAEDVIETHHIQMIKLLCLYAGLHKVDLFVETDSESSSQEY